MTLSIVFTFYQTLHLEHLERAIYSLARQTALDRASEMVFVDNNTQYDPSAIQPVLDAHNWPFPVRLHWCKHGNSDRRHSWSANYGIRAAASTLVFFTRADYILLEDCLERMAAEHRGDPLRFVSGWCWQMGYDRQGVTNNVEPPYEAYAWRTNARWLLQYPHAHPFIVTDQDAGTFLTSKQAMEAGGWFDEAMIGFGYQQSTLQRRMRGAGVKMVAVQDFLFCHQHHAADRDFGRAMQEYRQSKGG